MAENAIPSNITWTDPFKDATDQIWQEIKSIWTIPTYGLRHLDDTFGRLTLYQNDSQTFEVSYLSWTIQIHPEEASLTIIESPQNPETASIPAFYARERIALNFLRMIRGCLLLHAACISTPNGAIALLAPTGTGKSTLVGAMLQIPEITLISEDTLPVVQTESKYQVLPAASFLAMRHDLLNTRPFVQRIEPGNLKTFLRIAPNKCESTPSPLAALILLEPGKISKPEQIHPDIDLYKSLFRQQMVFSAPPLDFKSLQFRNYTSLVNNIPIYRMYIDLHDSSHIEESINALAGFCP